MKKFSPVLLLLAVSTSMAQQPTVDDLAFDMDVYIQVPKYTFTLGARAISGVKLSFSGSGSISTGDLPPLTGTDQTRLYNDGVVGLIDTTQTRPTPAGMTNRWFYRHASQVTPDGNIGMNAYRADIIDGGSRTRESDSSYGVEILASRDIGKLIARLDWNIGAGLSLNDVRAQMTTTERATVTTVTDVYSLDGATPPDAPYAAPSSSTETITNEDGTTTQLITDTTVFLGNEPVSRNTTTEVVDGRVTNNWELEGAYYTLRAGPTFVFPFTERLRASVSAGAAMIYSGTNYTITQTFQPDTGESVTETVTDSENKVLPGYYADANVEYWLTDRAGFYVGAVYQAAGDYLQSVKTPTADYSTRIDLSKLQGFRFGMHVKF